MTPFRALFQSKNNDMIDHFYGTIIHISSENGHHLIWFLDESNVLKSVDCKSYRVTKVD